MNRSVAQVSFCAVGDILLDRGVRQVIEENNINYPFEKIKESISQNDLAFFNLECPVADSSDGYPINKRNSFRAEISYIQGLKYAGFNIASVANNHTIDYGKRGFLKTIELLNENSIFTTGGGKDQQEAFEPLLIEKNGETFAFFGVLEFLLEGTSFNENSPYPAFGQIDRLCKLIRDYNSRVDNIIVAFHWGNENAILPTSRQIEYAHRAIDAGADLVLGHHPHVLQSIEIYHNKLILYSLGNFVFDNSGELQKQSIIFTCKFKDGNILMPELIPVYIKNNRPEPASSQIAHQIFEHLCKVSDPFQTRLDLSDQQVIQIQCNAVKPIKELESNATKFDIYHDRISVYMPNHSDYVYQLPDKNYALKDASIYSEDSLVFIYSIVSDVTTNKSRIAIFPFSTNTYTFLKPSIDCHDDFNPWKIEIMDVNADGDPELIVGVCKSTRYYKKEENRIFVFNRDKDYIYPKWLGSKIGNPIVDFKIDRNTNKLVLLEESNDTSIKKAVSYRWNGFGFDYDEILFDLKDYTNLEIQFQLSDYKFKTIL
jgi:poly-gamma-glutamate synthesis protein (capsule biosynthesis protein)